jgi:cytochrome c-type biogenesis protein CcmH
MNIYALFVVMIGLSTAWAVWFLYRPLQENNIDLTKSNTEIGKQKIKELELDLDSGLIDDDSFSIAEDEIIQTLAIEINHQKPETKNIDTSSISIWWAVFLCGLISTLSLTTYQLLSPQELVANTISKSTPIEQTFAAQLDKIKGILKDDGNNAEGWRLLGLTNFMSGNLPEAVSSYEKSYELNGENADMLIEYAVAIVAGANNELSDIETSLISRLIKETLDIEPGNDGARYLKNLISKEIVENKIQISNDKKHYVTIKVEISDNIRQSLDGDEFVMIYIKEPSGTPMPIAIRKLKLNEFSSGEITLTDADSIMPTRKLSLAGDIVGVVKISKQGLAVGDIGDIKITSKTFNVSDNPVITLYIK